VKKMAKIIIATGASATAASKAAKAANNAAMGAVKGILQDVSSHYEGMSNTIDNVGEQLDVIEQALDYQGENIPLTASGARELSSALKEYSKVQKAAGAALAKAEKQVLKAVAIVQKNKVAPPVEEEEVEDADAEE
jgi:methyl-accepting chemotaxis protein